MIDLFNKKKLKEMENKVKNLSLIINDKNKEIYRQNNSINHLENNQSKLLSENQELINWIMKILNTVGTMKTREKLNFKIPVYTQKKYRAYDRNVMGIFEKERITIPEITIIKMG